MSFQNAQNKMIKYLKSKKFRKREDAQTTLPSLPYLVKVNKLGYITINSQEGIYDKKYNIKERAYIIGFMKRKMALKYNYEINKTDKVAIIIHIMAGKKTNLKHSLYDLPVTLQNNKVITHYPLQLNWHEYYHNALDEAGLKQEKNIELVLTFDPKWCRKANSKNGLYKDVLLTLAKIKKMKI